MQPGSLTAGYGRCAYAREFGQFAVTSFLFLLFIISRCSVLFSSFLSSLLLIAAVRHRLGQKRKFYLHFEFCVEVPRQ